MALAVSAFFGRAPATSVDWASVFFPANGTSRTAATIHKARATNLSLFTPSSVGSRPVPAPRSLVYRLLRLWTDAAGSSAAVRFRHDSRPGVRRPGVPAGRRVHGDRRR